MKQTVAIRVSLKGIRKNLRDFCGSEQRCWKQLWFVELLKFFARITQYPVDVEVVEIGRHS